MIKGRENKMLRRCEL